MDANRALRSPVGAGAAAGVTGGAGAGGAGGGGGAGAGGTGDDVPLLATTGVEAAGAEGGVEEGRGTMPPNNFLAMSARADLERDISSSLLSSSSSFSFASPQSSSMADEGAVW